MKLITLAAAVLLLSGCATTQLLDQPLFTKYKYVVTTVPEELLTIPAPTYRIDPATATDKEGAKWIVDDKGRAIELEKRLKAIKAWQDRQLLEIKKLPEADVVKR